MKSEERALIIMEPEWAYGPQGLPPMVPKNCPVFMDLEILTFEVLLFSFGYCDCDIEIIIGMRY